MQKIIKYVIIDILRNKIVIGYTLFLLAITMSIFNLEDQSTKGLLSLLNIILIVVPLVCILFSAIYVYNSSEFIELLVSQPIKRSTILLSMFTGLSFSMVVAFLIGTGIPILLFEPTSTGITMMGMGVLLTLIFVSVALLTAVYARDKAKGIGWVILLWLYFSLLFDGLILFILYQFSDYPLEKAMVGVSALNPIDLSRILVLLKMDVSAMMGYTGAIFRNFFGTQYGFWIAIAVMLMWAFIPLFITLRKFKRKDL
ncbi:MAG TPA: ABC transporter permease subunit [Ferruginibacter sp.]|nr:ABC transporter permease subunit [Ferruginibacter sp.]HRO06136.1 ABC transporter permease subunit [Ferruginibacter sp.]HRO97334.1 ABC transporter permease subunit [Ferruginibacter sp.]HRP50551.1 ABC transporter permease subunit [Ferruginibacter sp.]